MRPTTRVVDAAVLSVVGVDGTDLMRLFSVTMLVRLRDDDNDNRDDD